jgi:hypothetical protein
MYQILTIAQRTVKQIHFLWVEQEFNLNLNSKTFRAVAATGSAVPGQDPKTEVFARSHSPKAREMYAAF